MTDLQLCAGSKRYGCEERLPLSEMSYYRGEWFCPRCLRIYTNSTPLTEVLRDDAMNVAKEDDDHFNAELFSTLKHSAGQVDKKRKRRQSLPDD